MYAVRGLVSMYATRRPNESYDDDGYATIYEDRRAVEKPLVLILLLNTSVEV